MWRGVAQSDQWTHDVGGGGPCFAIGVAVCTDTLALATT